MTENGIEHHEAFEGAGQEPGDRVWRIEKFEPVLQQSKTFGQFYNKDAYILLHTRKVQNKLVRDIHFWLGKGCAQDESGTAAIRTVELDDYLGGAAVQHREVQGHESKLFLSYFPKGIKYLEGGVESGFRPVDRDAYIRCLFQCKGKHTIRVEQVELKCASLNQADVFILDDGPNMYVWIGPKSARATRIKSIDIARRIRDDDKAGRAYIHIVDDDWNTNADFFKALGSKDKEIRAADPAADEDIIRKLDQAMLLYRAFDRGEGDLGVEEVAEKPLSRSVLNSDDCYVLDSGYSGIYVWTGRNCSSDFKKKVWQTTNEFIATRGYPDWMAVTRVLDTAETQLFKQYFSDWEDEEEPIFPEDPAEGGNTTEGDEEEGVDASELHKRPEKAEEFLPDDGSGTIQVWKVEHPSLVRVPEEAYGFFFGEDCYVMQYTYEKNGRENYILYFWQGLKSTTEDKASSALHTMDIDDKLGGQGMQIRVVQNKEPAHFLKVFNGRLVMFMGGHITGFRNIQDHEAYVPDDTMMFHIRGDSQDRTRAIQVAARGASLNSNDIFIIESRQKTYVWAGKNCRESEKEMAKYCLQFVAPGRGDPVVVLEGEETPIFWELLGGEESYYTGPRKSVGVRSEARLFHCSNSSGRFTVEEVVGFNQQDLDEDDIMILDTFDEVFVWIGQGANDIEKKEALKTSYNYLESDPTGRTPDNTLIVVVRQGFEPPQFTGHFHPWDTELWNEGKTFQEIIDEIGQENAGINLLEDEVKKYTSNYPLDVLQRRLPPEGVNVLRKEMYLNDEDFEQVFEMPKEAYLELPQWKRNELKKRHKLF